MAVAYDASSKAVGQTGTFSWTHTPAGTPKGILVFIFNLDASADNNSGVTYNGLTVPAVTGGLAQDTVGEPCFCKAWFLGSSVPTGAQTVQATCSGGNMCGVATTVTADTDTEIYLPGIVLLQGDQAVSEQSVNDGSPGTNSTRFAGLATGLNSLPSAGANSTVIQSSDEGVMGISAVRENTAGQGSRSIGWSGSSDDVAAVHLAIREIIAAPPNYPGPAMRIYQTLQAVKRGSSF